MCIRDSSCCSYGTDPNYSKPSSETAEGRSARNTRPVPAARFTQAVSRINRTTTVNHQPKVNTGSTFWNVENTWPAPTSSVKAEQKAPSEQEEVVR